MSALFFLEERPQICYSRPILSKGLITMHQIPARHKILWTIIRPLAAAFLFLKFGYRYKTAKNLPENYIVLANHTTDYDPIFVAASFPKQMYFVGSEHISRWKLAYPLLKWGFQPILRYKGTSAASTVMEMLRALRKGANICMFPEGARSWNGVTAPILPSTGKVVKSAKCGLVTYKIEGGYFASPNWSEKGTRRGRVRGAVVNTYSAEDLAKLSIDEINAIINRDLYEDAYDRQLTSPAPYRGKQIAYRMENLLSHCPHCRTMDSVFSKKDTVTCSHCGHHFRYTKYGLLEGIEQTTVKELFAWQKQQVLQDAADNIPYYSASGTLHRISEHTQTELAHDRVIMDRDSLTCGSIMIKLSDMTDMAMHGRHALVFSVGDTYYELLLNNTANALKFHLLYQAHTFGDITKYN